MTYKFNMHYFMKLLNVYLIYHIFSKAKVDDYLKKKLFIIKKILMFIVFEIMSSKISTLLSKSNIILITKFMIVGAIGTVVNLLTLYILTDIFHVYYIVSAIIAFILSVLNNYFINKVWTFKENLQEEAVKKGMQYLIVSIFSLFVNLGILYILVEIIFFWYILAELIAIICSFMINFIGSILWTFRKKKTVD